jgi:sugar phosphate isomerase/epimerase
MKSQRMRRREFLSATLAGVAASSFSLGLFAAPAPARVPGIQLWSVRREIAADPAGTLRQIAEFGYRFVETAGTGGLPAAEFRKLLDDNGLVCISAHQSFDAANLQKTFDEAKTLGAKYTTSGMLRAGTGAPPVEGTDAGFMGTLRAMTADDAKSIAAFCNHIGEGAKANGLTYCYHNHFFEFVELAGGATGYDILLNETDPALVVFEQDCGWTAVAGKNPAALLAQHASRMPLLHIKDFLPLAAGAKSAAQRRSTELGKGEIDYAPILAAAASADVEHYFVEQEDPFTNLTPLEAARANYATLAQWLGKYA